MICSYTHNNSILSHDDDIVIYASAAASSVVSTRQVVGMEQKPATERRYNVVVALLLIEIFIFIFTGTRGGSDNEMRCNQKRRGRN